MENMGEINRIKRADKFDEIYEILCNRKRVSPLNVIRAHSTNNRLMFCCDRVGFEDWSPILKSLAADRSLVEIQIFSRYRPKKIDETIDTQEKLDKDWRLRTKFRRGPIIYTNYLLRCFVDALAVCARDSTILTSLCLDGIPLTDGKYLEILCSGLAKNRNLQNLSLARCAIGDEGCDSVLGAVLEDTRLRVINFTACSLTSRSADFFALFLTKKRINLLRRMWHETGATNHEETETNHQGLRELVLDGNRKFSDDGLRLLARTLKDDFWLKNLSLRRCGLTKISGDVVIDLLGTNSIIEIMNLRKNRIPLEVARTVRRLLKRRRDKGERIPLKRRLLDRKKDPKCTNGTRLRKYRREIRGCVNKKLEKNSKNGKNEDNVERKPNLMELNDRLSNVIDRNRDLTRGLTNDKRLLASEKLSRIDAENSYRSLKSAFEGRLRGARKHDRICDRIVLETKLCGNVREIFRRLEQICEKNANARDELDEKVVEDANEATIVTHTPMNRRYDDRTIVRNMQKRPHCPRRQKFQRL